MDPIPFSDMGKIVLEYNLRIFQSLIIGRSSEHSEFYEIVIDYGNPLEIIREAISNAFDWHATQIVKKKESRGREKTPRSSALKL